MPRFNVQHPVTKEWRCFSTIVNDYVTDWMDEEKYQRWRLEEYGKHAGEIRDANLMDYEEADQRIVDKRWKNREGKMKDMSKYIIEIEEKPLCVFDKDTQTYFPRLWRVKGFNSLVFDKEGLSRLEELNPDYINKHFGELQDTAYQKGFEDGKKEAESSEVIEQAKVDAFNKGMLHKGEKIHDAYQRGLHEGNDIGYKDGVKDGQNEAWEVAKKLFSTMAESDIEKAFPIEWNSGGFKALMNLQPQKAIAKLKAYEDDKIKRGDIVNVKGSCNDDLLGVVTKVCEDNCYIMWGDGSGGALSKDSVVKTGKHIDVDKFLGGLSSDN